MATVPGNPVDDGGIPKELQPTWGDIVMATSIMDQQGKFQVAGDVIPYGKGPAPETLERLGKAIQEDKGFLKRPGAFLDPKVKILTPTPKEW